LAVILALAGMSVYAGEAGPAAPPAGKEERVADTAYSVQVRIDGNLESYEVYRSMNTEERFYVAPQLRFLSADDVGNIASLGVDDKESAVVNMRIQLVPVAAKMALAQELAKMFPEVENINVSDLCLDAVMFDLFDDRDKVFFGTQGPYLVKTPPYARSLDAVMRVRSEKADEFQKAINGGRITFLVSYGFNKVNLDYRQEMLDSALIKKSKSVQNLEQSGASVMNAQQMADTAQRIRRDISSRVIQELGGTIEPQSVPIDRLFDLFRVGEAWNLAENERRELEERWWTELNLDVDKKDFQPFKVQKHVIDIMNTEKEMTEKRKLYQRDYEENKQVFNASAKAKYSGGSFGASGQSSYALDAKNVEDSKKMTDDQFRDFIKAYHGVEYDTQDKLYRGLAIYDAKRMLSDSRVRLISVTVKPYLANGVKNLPLRPNAPVPIVLMETVREISKELGLAPVGSIVMWWGAKDGIPNGWEVCNGDMPSDPKATLKYRKPDLQGKFTQGAGNTVLDVTKEKPGGNTMQTLGGENLPDHQHTVKDAYYPGSPYQEPPRGATTARMPLPGGIGIDGHFTSKRGGMKLLAVESKTEPFRQDAPKAFDNRPDFLQVFFIIRTR